MNRAVALLAFVFVALPSLALAQAPSLTTVSPDSGSPLGGETITLNGTDFTALDNVDFGGVVVPITFVTTTAMTVTAPAHAPGAVDITVTNANGTSTLTGAYTYLDPPALVSLSVTQGTPLGGTAVTLNGTHFTAADTVTFGGVVVPTTFTTTTALTLNTPAHAPGPVDVTVANANGSSTLTSAFTYLNPPTLLSLAPSTGTPLGGETVTITGSGFDGTESVTVDGVAALALTFVSPTSLTFTTAAHASGPVDIVVTNANGTDTLVGGFTYNAAPVLSSLAPTNGSPLGGTTVTLTGSGFTGADGVTFDGAAAAVTFDSATQLTVTTPAHAAGAVDVVVSNANGSSTLSGGYTYDAPPVLASLAPSNGTPLGGTTVTLSGSGFTAADTVTFDGIAAAVTFDSATQLTVTTPAHAAGAVDVVVSNVNGSSTLSGGFTYDDPPALISLAPANGSPLGGTTVTLTGSGFTAADAVTFDGAAAAVTFDSATQLTVTAPAHAPGSVDVTISNGNGSTTLVGGFTYDNPPALASLAPTSGTPFGGTTVTLTGSGFTAADTVTFGGNAAAVTFDSATQLTVTTPAHSAGTVDVVVTNVNGTSTLVGGYTYNNPPALISISPNNGTPLGGTAVTLNGSSFTAADVVSFDGSVVPVTFVSATALIATAPAHAPGAVNVTVSNANGSSTLTGAYTYNTPATITSVSPSTGASVGGEAVTINGTNFTGSETVSFDGTVAASVFISSTQLGATTPPHASGAVNVTVANANGTDTLVGGFTYIAPPALTSLTPANGTPLGGDTITLNGTDFTVGDTVTVDGAAVPVTFLSTTSLTIVTAAHAPGAVDVVVTNANGSSTLAGGFTYDTPPVITAVTPNNGSPLGGTTVTITGSDLTATSMVSFGGATVPVTLVSATEVTAVTPAGAPGVVDVTLSNANGSSTLTGAYTYNNPPNLLVVNPGSGSALGGQAVTLLGNGFTADVAVTFDGIPAASVAFISATSVLATTPAHAAGPVDVALTTVNGTSTIVGGFTYNAQPSITSVTPSVGGPAGGTSVTIAGAGFLAGTIVRFDGVIAPATVVSATSIFATSPAHAAGVVDVTVTNSNGVGTLSNAFTYLSAPQVASILPTSGSPIGGTTVTLTGSDFDGSETVTFGGIAATSVAFLTSSTLTAVTPPHAAGSVDVVITNNNGSNTLVGGFTYEGAPTIAGLTPNSGLTVGGDSITVNGTNFNGSETVTFGGAAATSVTFVSATSLTVVTPAQADGVVDVVVTNGNGSATLVDGFTYGSPTPTITSIAPTNGPQSGGTTVGITGTNFTAADTVTFGGLAAAVTFNSSTSLSATTPAQAAGTVDVTVTNVNGTDTLVGAFTYDAPPTIASITPSVGSPVGGTAVTVTGTAFVAGTTVTIGGNVCSSIVITSATEITCFTPVGLGGPADVVVTNANGSDTIAGGFTYDLPPVITSIDPDAGSPAGGDNVTITGTSFSPTTDVFFDGVPATVVVFLGPTSLTATTPAHAAASVDVTVTNENGSDTLTDGYTYLSPNVMRIVDANATPGSSVSLLIELTTERDIKGYTTAMTFDETMFTLTGMNVAGLDVELLVGPINQQNGIEFFDTTIDNVSGFGIAAAVFDLSPPFLSQGLLAGGPYSIVRYSFDTAGGPALIGTSHTFSLVDGMGSPPVNNAVSYQNEIGQTLTLNPQRQTGRLTFVDTQTFKRADANGDGFPNIADAIFLISYIFNAGAAPQCMSAANANGDALVDISDIITIIQWQFGGGSQPPAPFPSCGADTGNTFDCGSYNGC